MSCCGLCCKLPKRNDYKVSTVEIELEPLGGDKAEPKKNGVNNRYGNRRQGGPVKVSVVGGGNQRGSGIWRRERIEMTEPELDDVAFLTGTGDSNSGRPAREGVAVCSQKRALCVTSIVLGALLGTALIIAYAGPQNDCACAGKKPPGYVPDYYNSSTPFQPIATNGQPFPWIYPYLPNNVRPVRYTLTIHPNLTTLDVKGQVTIEFHVEKETNFIVLHIQDLNVTEKGVFGPKGFSLKVVKLLEYPPRQQLYIELREKLRKKNNYTLNLRWYSRLSSEPEGFYVDQYESVNGIKRMLAATVFEPGGARKAFPCFDEPHQRAPFKLSVFRDRFHLGLSNSLVQTTDDVGFYMGTGLLRDDFYETPALPPDAIAWVVSDFQRESLEPSSTYQISSTTAAPFNLLTYTTTSTDSIHNKADKRPNRNLTAALITRGLIHPYESSNQNHHETHASLQLNNNNNHQHDKGENHKNLNGTLDHEILAEAITEIRTAPSYTFYSSRSTLKKFGFILNTSRDVLEYLQTWLGVAYPLPKLDFVALPSVQRDLTSSLGLVTTRAEFVSELNTIPTREYHMSGVKIADAILRQFFGGITSSKVWKHAWLWEGIVKYLSRLVLGPLQPQWSMDELHLVETVTSAMDIDAIQGWESIINGTSEDGKNEQFYIDKAASILAMLHSAMGEDNFRACLGTFLNNNKFQTSEPIELWTTCTKQTNGTKNIKEMMNLWTTLPGFPLVTVTKVGNSVSITQTPFEPKEFLAIEDDPSIINTTTTTSTTTTTTTQAPNAKLKKPTKWIFPLSYITDLDNVTDSMLMTQMDLQFTLPSETKWIKVNADQNGYYRVLYDNENWGNLIREINNNHEIFSPKDRIGLISDVFTLCHANLLPCPITMDLVTYLPVEMEWGPMAVGLRHLERWRRILKYSECFLMLTEFVRSILIKSVSSLGWLDIDTDEKRLLRAEVLLASVLWEEPSAIEQTKKYLNLVVNNHTEIPPNLREVVYTGGVLSGEIVYWQHCWDRFTKLEYTKEGLTERMELLRALGKTKDAWLQNRLLSHVISLPTVEVVQVLEAIAGTPTGGAMACRFLQAKWSILQSKFGAGSVNFARVISAITKYGATKFDYDELKSLVERFGDGPGMRILNMTLRSVATNVEWVSRSQSAIYNWVDSFETNLLYLNIDKKFPKIIKTTMPPSTTTTTIFSSNSTTPSPTPITTSESTLDKISDFFTNSTTPSPTSATTSESTLDKISDFFTTIYSDVKSLTASSQYIEPSNIIIFGTTIYSCILLNYFI